MSYDEWKQAFRKAIEHDEQRRAQLWNLDHQCTCEDKVREFKEHLGTMFAECIKSIPGLSKEDTAVQVFVNATDRLTKALRGLDPHDECHKWLGQDTLTAAPNDLAANTKFFTYIDLDTLERYYEKRIPSPPQPEHPVALDRPIKATKERQPVARFIWVTWPPIGGQPLPDNPTRLYKELGIVCEARTKETGMMNYAFRCELELSNAKRVFRPSVFDASVAAVWKPVTSDVPHGLTRDLTTGESRWPELLVETADYIAESSPKLNLVSPPNTREPLRPTPPNYLANRPGA